MKISTSTRRTLKEFGEEEGIAILSRAGYDCLDLSIDVYTDLIRDGSWQDKAAELRALSEKYGITYNQAHAPFGGGRGDLSTRGNYATNLAPIIPEAIRMAAKAGVDVLVVHPINFLDTGYLGHEEEHFEANMQFYSKLAPIARDLGVRIGIENLWLTSSITGGIVPASCADPHEHISYLAALDAPDVFTACLDIGHSALVGRDPADVIRILGHKRLGALHVHDVDGKTDLHTLPWQSKLNWESIAKALGEIDYSGVLTLEADYFIAKMPRELVPDCEALMAKTARHLANLVDRYRPAK